MKAIMFIDVFFYIMALIVGLFWPPTIFYALLRSGLGIVFPWRSPLNWRKDFKKYGDDNERYTFIDSDRTWVAKLFELLFAFVFYYSSLWNMDGDSSLVLLVSILAFVVILVENRICFCELVTEPWMARNLLLTSIICGVVFISVSVLDVIDIDPLAHFLDVMNFLSIFSITIITLAFMVFLYRPVNAFLKPSLRFNWKVELLYLISLVLILFAVFHLSFLDYYYTLRFNLHYPSYKKAIMLIKQVDKDRLKEEFDCGDIYQMPLDAYVGSGSITARLVDGNVLQVEFSHGEGSSNCYLYRDDNAVPCQKCKVERLKDKWFFVDYSQP